MHAKALQELEDLNKVYKLSITYDFDYTTETLDGQKLLDMITVNDDKTITATQTDTSKWNRTFDFPAELGTVSPAASWTLTCDSDGMITIS